VTEADRLKARGLRPAEERDPAWNERAAVVREPGLIEPGLIEHGLMVAYNRLVDLRHQIAALGKRLEPVIGRHRETTQAVEKAQENGNGIRGESPMAQLVRQIHDEINHVTADVGRIGDVIEL
jgi:hypothetical protein